MARVIPGALSFYPVFPERLSERSITDSAVTSHRPPLSGHRFRLREPFFGMPGSSRGSVRHSRRPAIVPFPLSSGVRIVSGRFPRPFRSFADGFGPFGHKRERRERFSVLPVWVRFRHPGKSPTGEKDIIIKILSDSAVSAAPSPTLGGAPLNVRSGLAEKVSGQSSGFRGGRPVGPGVQLKIKASDFLSVPTRPEKFRTPGAFGRLSGPRWVRTGFRGLHEFKRGPSPLFFGTALRFAGGPDGFPRASRVQTGSTPLFGTAFRFAMGPDGFPRASRIQTGSILLLFGTASRFAGGPDGFPRAFRVQTGASTALGRLSAKRWSRTDFRGHHGLIRGHSPSFGRLSKSF
jgi:hypothetical protein